MSGCCDSGFAVLTSSDTNRSASSSEAFVRVWPLISTVTALISSAVGIFGRLGSALLAPNSPPKRSLKKLMRPGFGCSTGFFHSSASLETGTSPRELSRTSVWLPISISVFS